MQSTCTCIFSILFASRSVFGTSRGCSFCQFLSILSWWRTRSQSLKGWYTWCWCLLRFIEGVLYVYKLVFLLLCSCWNKYCGLSNNIGHYILQPHNMESANDYTHTQCHASTRGSHKSPTVAIWPAVYLNQLTKCSHSLWLRTFLTFRFKVRISSSLPHPTGYPDWLQAGLYSLTTSQRVEILIWAAYGRKQSAS